MIRITQVLNKGTASDSPTAYQADNDNCVSRSLSSLLPIDEAGRKGGTGLLLSYLLRLTLSRSGSSYANSLYEVGPLIIRFGHHAAWKHT